MGGGTAGIIVASRLAENEAHNVLLIEAGPKVSLLHDIPLATSMFQKSTIDWKHQTESQINACLAMNNNVYKIQIINYFKRNIISSINHNLLLFISL